MLWIYLRRVKRNYVGWRWNRTRFRELFAFLKDWNALHTGILQKAVPDFWNTPIVIAKKR
jgi:hypothetical protein